MQIKYKFFSCSTAASINGFACHPNFCISTMPLLTVNTLRYVPVSISTPRFLNLIRNIKISCSSSHKNNNIAVEAPLTLQESFLWIGLHQCGTEFLCHCKVEQLL